MTDESIYVNEKEFRDFPQFSVIRFSGPNELLIAVRVGVFGTTELSYEDAQDQERISGVARM